MTTHAPRWLDVAGRTTLAAIALATLASCGSGAVSAPPVTVTPGPISITPETATLYSNLPTTFVVSGGNGSYIVTSSDQAVLPLAGSFSGSQLTVIPQEVAADTAVTLTIRDTGTAAPVNATLTVKPRTVSNVVTVTPSASQAAVCGSAVCAGGDAEVKVAIARNGVPLLSREVRFDVVSGDFRIINSAPGAPETLALSGTTLTDGSGVARIRVRALNDATSQTALLQITDVAGGSFQRTSFAIAPSSNAPLNAQPSTISFRSTVGGQCPNNITADVIVFGGRPPYSITQPGPFTVSPTLVTQNGGRFSVTAKGQCSDGSPIAIVDNAGATVTVTASASAPTLITAPTLAASPTSVTLDSCNTIATIAVAGGVGPPYFATSGHNGITAQPFSQNSVRIARASGSAAITPSSVTVSVSDGQTVKDITVNLVGAGQGAC